MPKVYKASARHAAADRLAYSIHGVGDATDSGRTKIFQWIRTGRLRAKKLDGKTIVLANDLKTFLARLPDVR
jgi:hypothetical protein